MTNPLTANISDAEMNPSDVEISGSFDTDVPAEKAKTEEPAPAAEEPVQEAEGEEEAAVEDEQPKKPTAKDRIRELNAEKRAERSRAEAAEARLAQFESRFAALENKNLTSAPNPANPANIGGSPNPENYEYGALDQRYIQDLTRFQVETELASASRRQQEQAERDVSERKVQETRVKAQGVIANGEQAYDDFYEVVVDGAAANKYPLQQSALEAILEADNPADIAYELAKNPAEAAKLASMTPTQQAKYVFSKDAEWTAKKKPRTTKAPEPAATLTRGNSGRFNVSGDTDDLGAFSKEFFAKR